MKIYRHRLKQAESTLSVMRPDGVTAPAPALPLGAVLSMVAKKAETAEPSQEDLTWRVFEHETEVAQIVRRAATGEVWTLAS